MSALAIGSMMPDFAFFLGVSVPRGETHSLLSLLSWSLPTGLLLYIVFHVLLRRALIELAPSPVQERVATVPRPGHAGIHDWLAIVISLLCGAVTHLVWDSFTHVGTATVRALPILAMPLAIPGVPDPRLYSLLQILSTLAGLALLAYWIARWYVRTAPASGTTPALRPAARWTICTLLVVLPPAAGLLATLSSAGFHDKLVSFIFTTLPAFFWLLVAYALARHAVRRGSARP